MVTSDHYKKIWEVRRQKYGDSGVSEKGLEKLRELQRKTKTGKPLTEEHRQKISLANKNRPHPWLIGRKVSEETRNKSSLSQKGKECPQRGRKGRIITEEWRQNISNCKKGIVVDRSKHDKRILIELERLRGDGYLAIPTGLWKFPVPDLVKIKDGLITAIEIELNGKSPSKLERKVKRYREYFDSVDVVT